MSGTDVTIRGVTEALLALAGVLIGGLTTTGTALFFARRNERRALLTAARLVREDVVEAGPSLETLLRRGWFQALPLEVPGWEEHRVPLAGALPKDDWDEVADAIAGVRRVRVMIDELLALGDGGIDPDAIPPDGHDVVTGTLRALERAADVLDRDS
jgi:hypothetical protein